MLETQARRKKKHRCTFYWWVYFSEKWKQACWSSANFQSLGVNTHSSDFTWPAFNSPRASFPHPSCPMECWHCKPSPYCIWLVCGWPPHHLSSLSSAFSFPQLLRGPLTYVGIKLYFVYSFYWSPLKIQSHSVTRDGFRLAMRLTSCFTFLRALSCLTQNYFVWMSSCLHILCFGFLKHLIIQPHIS